MNFFLDGLFKQIKKEKKEIVYLNMFHGEGGKPWDTRKFDE